MPHAGMDLFVMRAEFVLVQAYQANDGAILC